MARICPVDSVSNICKALNVRINERFIFDWGKPIGEFEYYIGEDGIIREQFEWDCLFSMLNMRDALHIIKNPQKIVCMGYKYNDEEKEWFYSLKKKKLWAWTLTRDSSVGSPVIAHKSFPDGIRWEDKSGECHLSWRSNGEQIVVEDRLGVVSPYCPIRIKVELEKIKLDSNMREPN